MVAAVIFKSTLYEQSLIKAKLYALSFIALEN